MSHKAVVNQRLGEYEKSAEHISEKFDEFDAIRNNVQGYRFTPRKKGRFRWKTYEKL